MEQIARNAIVILATLGCLASPATSHAVTIDAALDPQDGNIDWRWIGVGTCNSPNCLPLSGWSSRKLFPNTASLSRCEELASFWLHEKDKGPVLPGDISHLENLEWTDPDVVGLSTPSATRGALSSEILSELEIARLNKRFYDQMGRLDPLPSHLGVGDASSHQRPRVRLTLVDSSPDSPAENLGNTPEKSPHGEALTLFAKKLLCNDYPTVCIANVHTRLALAYEWIDPVDKNSSERNEDEGGFLGLVGELAEVLIGELVSWNETGPSKRDRLVINLSLAWDPLLGGQQLEREDMPTPIRAVYSALECLSKYDAIVVGAAGNFSDAHPSNETGNPLLPAGWTSRQSATPLIYAAGGMSVKRRPLANSLAGGMPEFAAYSDHAATAAGHLLTGSSVGALGLSTTLAAVAFYAPDLSREEIADLVYTSGEWVGSSADFCRGSIQLNGECPLTSYVSLCQSVVEACKLGAGECHKPPTSCAHRPKTLLRFWRPDPPPIYDANLLSHVNSSGGFCPLDPLVSLAPPLNPCPSRQYHGLARMPGLHPQPQADKCPTCKVELSGGNVGGIMGSGGKGSGNGVFYGELTGLKNNEYIKNVTLTLTCPGDEEYAFQPTQVVFSGNNNLVSIGGLPACDTAALSYTLHSPDSLNVEQRLGSMSSPILVVGN